MLQVIKRLLLKMVDDIDAGNSNISQKEMVEIIEALRRYNYRDKYISKYQAYTYLNISRAKFDNLVREGKIPRGKKVEGFKELQWSLKEIKDVANRNGGTEVVERKQRSSKADI